MISTSAEGQGETDSLAYNAVGNPISSIDPLGQETTATYNSNFDGLQTITNPLGQTLSDSYDATTGNLLSVTYPDGSSQEYAYDATGQVTQFINRDGQPISYSYYPNGLLESESFTDGTQDTFAYNGHDNMISMSDSTGTTTFAYDSGNRLIKVTYPDGEFLDYTYNSLGDAVRCKTRRALPSSISTMPSAASPSSPTAAET